MQSIWKNTGSSGMPSRKTHTFEELPNFTAVSLAFNHSPIDHHDAKYTADGWIFVVASSCLIAPRSSFIARFNSIQSFAAVRTSNYASLVFISTFAWSLLFVFSYLLSLWDKYIMMSACDFAFKETHTIAFHCNPSHVVSVHLPIWSPSVTKFLL